MKLTKNPVQKLTSTLVFYFLLLQLCIIF